MGASSLPYVTPPPNSSEECLYHFSDQENCIAPSELQALMYEMEIMLSDKQL